MKRKRRSRREAIDWMLFVRELTRFDSDLQYLKRVGAAGDGERTFKWVVDLGGTGRTEGEWRKLLYTGSLL
jgi:hypothetical protein